MLLLWMINSSIPYLTKIQIQIALNAEQGTVSFELSVDPDYCS